MELATMTKGTHDPNCSGCPCCDVAMARILKASPEELGRILAERDRGTGKGELKANAGFRTARSPVPVIASTEPPDPYAPTLDKLARKAGKARLKVTATPPEPEPPITARVLSALPPDYNPLVPPDPYARDLARLAGGER
jgi:hypothetical protein